jgi:hypothetical protein
MLRKPKRAGGWQAPGRGQEKARAPTASALPLGVSTARYVAFTRAFTARRRASFGASVVTTLLRYGAMGWSWFESVARRSQASPVRQAVDKVRSPLAPELQLE